ncbi:MFS transporter [Thermococcus sp. 21S9]|uniref:MFS transporter n=1 Tax=Thermococcus sp. 21S9 TaxID=1638223 RepID=UPI001438FD89|nr:MFS transporter [Thermococcus sp. 21S9]NJE54960.1 MFS transporter [Thermococcus sp. 21S9]
MEKKFNWGTVLGLALLGFSMSTGWALNKGLSFKLLQNGYTNSAFIIGAVLSLQGLMGIFVPIVMGYYSDTSRFGRGRRTPFILAGGIFAGLVVLGVYFSYIARVPLLAFATMLALFYFAMYFYVAQYRSLMPDVIPSGERGRASGIITLFEWAGNLFLFGSLAFLIIKATKVTGIDNEIEALIKAGYMWIPFAVVAGFLMLSAFIVYAKVKEPAFPEEMPEEGLTDYLRSIVADRDFLKFYSAQILWWMSFEFVAVFMFGILESVLGTKDVTALGNAIMALFNVLVLVGAVVGGVLYDRMGRRKSIILGGLIFLMPFLAGWFVHTKLQITALIGFAGIGWGMLMSTSWPVIGDLLTKYEREAFNGRYYGFFEATKSFPILIAGLVGGAIVQLAGGNYKVLFPVGAIFVIIALPLIWGMKNLDEISKEKPKVEAIEETEMGV